MNHLNIEKFFHFRSVLMRSGWRSDTWISVNGKGEILHLSHSKPPEAAFQAIPVEYIDGFALPGFQNAHSHAFQYAMAGMAEHRNEAGKNDDFWTWRETMYHLASRITPDELEAIAALLFSEMLCRGITSVAEFHYLNNDPNGKPYPNSIEMALRIARAAEETGIHLTLVPVMYEQGGFSTPLKKGQIRFRTFGLETYQRTYESISQSLKMSPDTLVGIGVHSLRAVSPQDVLYLLKNPVQIPIHLHVAEQRQEVEDCIRYLGKNPVRWLLENLPLDDRFHLVHATHMTDDEAKDLGKSGATVVLCPSTEGNLGDGFFPLNLYRHFGGGCAFGTDSHIGLSPFEELRWLDYVQRLKSEKRNIVCTKDGDDSGTILFSEAWERGRKAMGLTSHDFFAKGSSLDAIIVNPNHPILYGKPEARRLGAIIYGGDHSLLAGTIRRGKWLVKDNHHVFEDQIKTRFMKLFHSFWR